MIYTRVSSNSFFARGRKNSPVTGSPLPSYNIEKEFVNKGGGNRRGGVLLRPIEISIIHLNNNGQSRALPLRNDHYIV